MQKTIGQKEFRPFHETIIAAINRCPGPANREIFRLFVLIKETRIPKGHDEIIAAIDEFFAFAGSSKWARDIRLVKESILEQKLASEQKLTEEASAS